MSRNLSPPKQDVIGDESTSSVISKLAGVSPEVGKIGAEFLPSSLETQAGAQAKADAAQAAALAADSAKANLNGGNTFTGNQTFTAPPTSTGTPVSGVALLNRDQNDFRYGYGVLPFAEYSQEEVVIISLANTFPVAPSHTGRSSCAIPPYINIMNEVVRDGGSIGIITNSGSQGFGVSCRNVASGSAQHIVGLGNAMSAFARSGAVASQWKLPSLANRVGRQYVFDGSGIVLSNNSPTIPIGSVVINDVNDTIKMVNNVGTIVDTDQALGGTLGTYTARTFNPNLPLWIMSGTATTPGVWIANQIEKPTEDQWLRICTTNGRFPGAYGYVWAIGGASASVASSTNYLVLMKMILAR
jgi:hypothetical protein